MLPTKKEEPVDLLLFAAKRALDCDVALSAFHLVVVEGWVKV